MKSIYRILTLLTVLFLLLGCSSSNMNPVIDISEDLGFKAGSLDALPVIGYDGISALGLFGAYDLVLDMEGKNAEVIPIRSASEGESYIVSGEAFFSMSPCSDCLKIRSISLDENENIVLGMTIKHPFPEGDPLKPPTALNRLDLDVFDLALIVQPLEFAEGNFPLLGAQTYPGLLINANGYTGELKDVTGSNALLPYKICYESPDYNRFEMGTDYHDFDMVLNPGEQTNFQLYLTMGYGASARRPERLNPTYYIPEFNRKAAWKVEVVPPEGDDPPEMGNTWDDNDTTTEFIVTIDVYDWNHGVDVDPGFPDRDRTDHLSASSDVLSVQIEIPGMISSIITADTDDTTTNGWDDPLTYTASIANENGVEAGVYYGLVKVTDSRLPGNFITGGEPDTLVHTPDGILLEWMEMPEFATYQIFSATVVEGALPPVCDIYVEPLIAGQGETIYADPGTSHHPDGNIIMYEYDAEYDGVNFNADVIQISTDPDFGEAVGLLMPCNTTGSDITVTVAIRVSDDNDPPQSSICTENITIETRMGRPRKVTADTVNRGENITNQYRITSIDLEWPDNPCVAEYLIERANDALNPTSWLEYDTTDTNFYKFQPADLMGTDRLRVIARELTGGNPTTDSIPSGEVLFIFDSHYISNGHSWIERNEYNTGSHWNFNTSTYGFASLDDVGNGGYGMASFNWICHYGICGSWPNSWAAWLTYVPDIEDQDAAYVDMYYHQNYYWDFGDTAAFVLGTSTGDMINGQETACDMIPTQDHRAFTPYNNQCEAIDVEFCETGMWGFSGNMNWTHTSYWLNDLLDDGPRDYFVMAWANGPMSGGQGNGYNDAQVIVVY